MTTDLVPTTGFDLAQQIFPPAKRKAIATFLQVEPDDPALLPYLAVCASYGLDPVMGQIWLIPQKARGRDGTEGERKYRPAVGRDGFLATARRDGRYRGMQYGVVCEHDVFEVAYDETLSRTDLPVIVHRFANKPVAFDEGEAPDRWRGRILGAWAKCYVEGQPTTFYFAPIREHMKLRHNRDGTVEPEGSWSYTSTMILKCAQSYVLRIALGVTGVVPADELREQSSIEGSVESEVIEAADFDWDGLAEHSQADPMVITALRGAVEHIETLAPMSWPAAKLDMVTGGMGEDDLIALAARITHEAEVLASRAQSSAAGRSGPPEGDAPSGQEPPAEGLTEAQRESAAALKRRAGELEEQLNEPDVSAEDAEVLAAELDVVEKQITAAEDPARQAELDFKSNLA
jgi:hypothetical protein